MEIRVREVCGSCGGDGVHCNYVGPASPVIKGVTAIMKNVEAIKCKECNGTGYTEYWTPLMELKTELMEWRE